MVLIFKRDGNCVEVPAASRVEVSNRAVLCFADDGEQVASFPLEEVSSYTANDIVVELLEDDICEDVEVIGAEPDGQPTSIQS
jgi:hypothetical protein